MLQNAYFLAKIGADTAENEQHFAKILPKTGNYSTGPMMTGGGTDGGGRPAHAHLGRGRSAAGGLIGLAKLGKLAKFCKFLAGSFSAVSKRNFARKYASDSIFQNLQDVHTFAPLQS